MNEIVGLLNSLPTGISIFVSLMTIGLVWFLHYKRINIDTSNTESSIHERQVKSLMEQLEMMSKDLNMARQQLVEIHNQNLELMEQLRIANRRISELETLIDNRSLI